MQIAFVVAEPLIALGIRQALEPKGDIGILGQASRMGEAVRMRHVAPAAPLATTQQLVDGDPAWRALPDLSVPVRGLGELRGRRRHTGPFLPASVTHVELIAAVRLVANPLESLPDAPQPLRAAGPGRRARPAADQTGDRGPGRDSHGQEEPRDRSRARHLALHGEQAGPPGPRRAARQEPHPGGDAAPNHLEPARRSAAVDRARAALEHIHDRQAAGRFVAETAVERLGADEGALAWWEPRRRRLRIVAAPGAASPRRSWPT